MRIDAHQHFWKYNPNRDSWITDQMHVIRRDFMPEDLKPLLETSGIDGCVAIQADQSEFETDFLLGLLEKNPWIKGVVGWLNLMGPDFDKRLEHYKVITAFKGVRHILQSEPDGFMTSSNFLKGIESVGKHELTYDILVVENQLEETLLMIKKIPEMRLVIDHIGKPNIKNRSFDHWAKFMRKICQFDHVHLKLSGMVTEADWEDWTVSQLRPYIDFCLEHFGAERLMFGSDWPVCLLAGPYKQVHQALSDSISELSATEQEMILGQTASNFYNLT